MRQTDTFIISESFSVNEETEEEEEQTIPRVAAVPFPLLYRRIMPSLRYVRASCGNFPCIASLSLYINSRDLISDRELLATSCSLPLFILPHTLHHPRRAGQFIETSQHFHASFIHLSAYAGGKTRKKNL